MRISRIFIEQNLAPGATVTLDKERSHYVATVLRLRAEAPVLLFNSHDGEYSARIAGTDKHAVSVRVDTLVRAPSPPRLPIHLGLGISRGDRMDFAVQKSTELGVSRITPIYTQFGEVKLKADRAENKLRHWRKIVASAAEQSGRLDIPEIDSPATLEDFHTGTSGDLRILLDPTGTVSFAELPAASSVSLLIGPEGGFSDPELDWAQSHDFSIVSLGDRILRTETAPIAALALLQFRFGDM